MEHNYWSTDTVFLKVLQKKIITLNWNSKSTNLITCGSNCGELCILDIDSTFSIDLQVGNINSDLNICGLKWAPNGYYLASGNSGDLLSIWDIRKSQPFFSSQLHNSAVKALDWAPWRSNFLASGGGTNDRTIKFWDIDKCQCIDSIDTSSQITSVIWSSTCKELVSSHGFQDNQLTVWNYPQMNRIIDLKCHKNRILSTAKSPDGEFIASVSPDDLLAIWKIFPGRIPEKIAKISYSALEEKWIR